MAWMNPTRETKDQNEVLGEVLQERGGSAVVAGQILKQSPVKYLKLLALFGATTLFQKIN